MSLIRVLSAWRAWMASLVPVLLTGLALIPTSAQAQQCYVNGSFLMNFGAVTGSGSASSTSINVTCAPDYSGTNSTFYYQLCVYLGPGDWSAGQPTRRMSNYNGSYLNYDLYSDPARTQSIGAVGSTPVYQVQLAVPPGSPRSSNIVFHGWVYPGQSVPAQSGYQEEGSQGVMVVRYDTTGFPSSPDCSSGGRDISRVSFSSSGVQASYQNGCWIVASDLDFGQVTPPQQALHAMTNVRVQCPAGTPWKLALDNGQHHDGTMRRMAGQGSYVAYQLYLDQSRTQVWGHDATNMRTGATDASGSAASVTIYGEVPPQPGILIGNYSDTIVATLYY